VVACVPLALVDDDNGNVSCKTPVIIDRRMRPALIGSTLIMGALYGRTMNHTQHEYLASTPACWTVCKFLLAGGD
jgi:hypothetical protein